MAEIVPNRAVNELKEVEKSVDVETVAVVGARAGLPAGRGRRPGSRVGSSVRSNYASGRIDRETVSGNACRRNSKE